ncbi:MAG: FMN-binding protein [Frankiales bacterium]|nr:FMN-binding protein [Frankiales bacterium]
MKRALVVGTGTVMGVAAVLALNPDGSSSAVALPTAGSGGTGSTATSGSTGSSGPSSSGSSHASSNGSSNAGTSHGTSGSSGSSGSSSGGSGSSGTTSATGAAIDVGYGIVQVKVTLTGGKITGIDAVQLPQNDGHSARISQVAWPMLVNEAMQAQSSQISGVSGASYTSYGFAQSLKAALVSLGHAA